MIFAFMTDATRTPFRLPSCPFLHSLLSLRRTHPCSSFPFNAERLHLELTWPRCAVAIKGLKLEEKAARDEKKVPYRPRLSSFTSSHLLSLICSVRPSAPSCVA